MPGCQGDHSIFGQHGGWNRAVYGCQNCIGQRQGAGNYSIYFYDSEFTQTWLLLKFKDAFVQALHCLTKGIAFESLR